MSTGSAIARQQGDGWMGNYHHSDGYPTGVGQELHTLYHTVFDRDVKHMQRVLIDDHPGGWSSIVGVDWSLSPGWEGNTGIDYDRYRASGFTWKHQPICYCHGDRNETDMSMTHETADPVFIEWVYIIGHDGIAVLESDGGAFCFVTFVHWNDTPDWSAIETGDVPQDLTS